MVPKAWMSAAAIAEIVRADGGMSAQHTPGPRAIPGPFSDKELNDLICWWWDGKATGEDIATEQDRLIQPPAGDPPGA